MERPTSFGALARMSDAGLVAHARECYGLGDVGLETAKRCVALVFERHRMLVRSVCGAKAPYDVVDDLEAAVYERFVRTVYLRQRPIENPAGLLVRIAQKVVATFHARRKPAGIPLDEIADMAEEDGYDAVAAEEVAAELLATLSERQREVVWGRLWEGLTGAEIAQRLDTTPGNVDVIFFRAMSRLREVLER